MTDSQWDKLLKIRTTGWDDSHSDQYRFPYEPTPYSVLERLAAAPEGVNPFIDGTVWPDFIDRQLAAYEDLLQRDPMEM